MLWTSPLLQPFILRPGLHMQLSTPCIHGWLHGCNGSDIFQTCFFHGQYVWIGASYIIQIVHICKHNSTYHIAFMGHCIISNSTAFSCHPPSLFKRSECAIIPWASAPGNSHTLSPLASLASPRSSGGAAHVQPGAGLPQPGVTSASVPSLLHSWGMLDSWSVLENHGPLHLYVKLPHLHLSFLFYRCLLRSSLYFYGTSSLGLFKWHCKTLIALTPCKRLCVLSQCKPYWTDLKVQCSAELHFTSQIKPSKYPCRYVRHWCPPPPFHQDPFVFLGWPVHVFAH